MTEDYTFPLGFEDDKEVDPNCIDGSENWDAMWENQLKVKHYGQALWDVALLTKRNLLLEYVGDDDEKVMQYIADNLDLDIPNEFMIKDLSEIVDLWVEKKISAAEARSELLRIFKDYLDGC
jgi:hypothetical protein